MSEHRYEAKVWQGDKGWHAKVLRNEIYFEARNGFENRNEAIAWAREQVAADKIAVEQERRAERVEL